MSSNVSFQPDNDSLTEVDLFYFPSTDVLHEFCTLKLRYTDSSLTLFTSRQELKKILFTLSDRLSEIENELYPESGNSNHVD